MLNLGIGEVVKQLRIPALVGLAVLLSTATVQAVSCATTAASSLTISSSCSFSGTVDGVDGSITISPGTTLTVNTGQTIVWSTGTPLTQNGAVVLVGTGNVKQSYLWMVDADADGWPSSTAITESPTSPGATYRRLNLMQSRTTIDCNDSAFSTANTCAATPGAPTGLSASVSGASSINLSWTAPASNGGAVITNYKIYRSTSPGLEVFVANAGAVTSYTDTSLAGGTTYYYRITAVNAAGESALSAEASATAATVPGAPTGVSVSATGANQLTVTWPAPTNGGSAVTGYKVYRSTASGGAQTLVGSPTTTSYTNTALTTGTVYYYKVSALNAVGESAQSGEASGTAIDVPGAPTLSMTAGRLQNSLSWTAPANGGAAITGYQIWRYLGPTSNQETLYTSVAATPTSYTDTALSACGKYWYKVLAVNSVGAGGLSNEIQSTPYDLAGVPAVSATPGNAQITISWTDPTAPTYNCSTPSYQVYRSATSGGALTLIASPAASPFTNTGLTNGTAYYYKVSSVNAAGESLFSAEASATAATVPGAPTGLAGTPGDTQITLAWVAPTSGGTAITGYKVYRATTSGAETLLVTLGATTSYVNTALTNGTTYYYKVSAINVVGEGSQSAEMSAVPNPPITCYSDIDGDGYGAGAGANYSGSCPVGKVTNAGDCYDFNAGANPGSPSWFSTDRGDGSFDYNCNGIIDKVDCYASVQTNGCFSYPYDPGYFQSGWITGYPIPNCGEIWQFWSSFATNDLNEACSSNRLPGPWVACYTGVPGYGAYSYGGIHSGPQTQVCR